MEEQVRIQNQQQINTEKKIRVQNRVAFIPNASFLEMEKEKERERLAKEEMQKEEEEEEEIENETAEEKEERKRLARENTLNQKKWNATAVEENKGYVSDEETLSEFLDEIVPESYSMDQAKEYLLHLPEIDLTTDEAVVNSYLQFAKMEEEFKKISAFEEAFLDGESLDPVYKELYTALKGVIGYGKARMNIISDSLYQQMTEDEVKALREKTENLTPEEKALQKKLNDCTVAETVFLSGMKKEEAGGYLSIRIRMPENTSYVPEDEEIQEFHNELNDFLDEEVFGQSQSNDEFEFGEGEEELISGEKILTQEQYGEMMMYPGEELHMEKEKNPDQDTLTEEQKEKDAEWILKNREQDRKNESMYGIWMLRDHYTHVLENRYSNLEDSDEMTQVKMSLFSLRIAIQGFQLDVEDLDGFRDFIDSYYEGSDAIYLGDYMKQPASPFTPEQIEEKFQAVIDSCQTYIDSHGGFTLKAITRDGRDRLRRVRKARERAEKELRLFRELKESGKIEMEGNALKDAEKVYAGIHQRLDVEERLLPAAKKHISNGSRRAREMSALVAGFTVLEKEDPYRFGNLFSGEDPVVKTLLKEFASSAFFKEMGQMEAELLSSLKAQYDHFVNLPVPPSFLKEEQDPFDRELRKQYALHRISVDGDYIKLRAMDRIHGFLTEGQKASVQKAFQGTGGGKTEEMRSLCSAGGILYQELKAKDDAGNVAPDLFAGMVTYTKESYANQLKKAVADLVPPFEATLELQEHFGTDENPDIVDEYKETENGVLVRQTRQEKKQQRAEQHARVAKKEENLKKHLKRHTDMLFLAENEEELRERLLLRTDPDYVEKLRKNEDTKGYVRKIRAGEWKESEVLTVTGDLQTAEKALRFYAMSNLLGMEGAVRSLRVTELRNDGQAGAGILMNRTDDVTLYDLTHEDQHKVNGQFVRKMSEKAQQKMAMIAVLDILCGREATAEEDLYCKVDRQEGIITDVYVGGKLAESFGHMSGKEAMRQLMSSAPQAIAKLDEKTRKRILSLGPVSLSVCFGKSLSRQEMNALSDRLKKLQERIRKVEKEADLLKNDMSARAVRDEKTLNVEERFDMNLTEKNVLQSRIDQKLQNLGAIATQELKDVLRERLETEENALQRIYRISLCYQRMERVQHLNEAKDPAVAMLLENLKKDVETAKRLYNTEATKEVEKLEQITGPEDVKSYIRGKQERE